MLASFHLHCLAGKTTTSSSNFTSLFPLPTVSSSMGRRGKQQREEDNKKRKRSREEAAKSVADIEDFSQEEAARIRDSLLLWYYKNQRVLPWRINQDEEKEGEGDAEREARAYAVWVSEVMLQQTRVPTVIDYYNRWMAKWPTVYDLAQASQEEVNEMWAGLGYYRRARFLLEGAKSIVGGKFPTTVSALRKVRGIGDYTAGAIASIAFKEVVPAVDGNVIRVIARLKAISANPKEPETMKSFWKLAGQLVDPLRPGDFNQALMELGATTCTPTSPGCSMCPISEQCRAFSISRNHDLVQVTDFPIKVVKAKPRNDFAAVCVVQLRVDQNPKPFKESDKSDFFLLVKRPEEGLLAGLWEFPSVLLDGEEIDMSLRRKAMDQYLKKSFKLDVRKNGMILLREDVGEYVHVFSHIRLRMYVELLVLSLQDGVGILNGKGNQGSIVWKCVDGKSIEGMGLTSGVRKVFNMVEYFKQHQQPKSFTLASRKRFL